MKKSRRRSKTRHSTFPGEILVGGETLEIRHRENLEETLGENLGMKSGCKTSMKTLKLTLELS